MTTRLAAISSFIFTFKQFHSGHCLQRTNFIRQFRVQFTLNITFQKCFHAASAVAISMDDLSQTAHGILQRVVDQYVVILLCTENFFLCDRKSLFNFFCISS